MLNLREIRFHNYMVLINELVSQNQGSWHGVFKHVQTLTGIPRAQLGHLKNKRRNIGDKTARQIEIGFGKPKGWLDSPPDGLFPVNEEEQKFVEFALRLYRESKEDAQAILSGLLHEHSTKNSS